METKVQKFYAKSNNKIALKVYSGHFVTPHSHITQFLDMTTLKTRASEAAAVAENLAARYSTNTIVDTIVCLDNTEVIGAYLAHDLSRSGVISMNAHHTIYIVKPEIVNGQILFRDNYKVMLEHKNVFILLGTATTGESMNSCINSVHYYGGRVTGIAAIFSAINKVADMKVESIFSTKDVPNYASYKPSDCPLCKEQQQIHALVNGYGYSSLHAPLPQMME